VLALAPVVVDRTLRITAAIPDGAGGLWIGAASGERCGTCFNCRHENGYPCARDTAWRDEL